MNVTLLIYIICLNLVTFVIMFSDKRRAMNHRWRIPEKTIFLLSFLGGSFGSLCGMYIFRHKTKHLSFRILLPVFLVLNFIAIFLIILGDIF